MNIESLPTVAFFDQWLSTLLIHVGSHIEPKTFWASSKEAADDLAQTYAAELRLREYVESHRPKTPWGNAKPTAQNASEYFDGLPTLNIKPEDV